MSQSDTYTVWVSKPDSACFDSASIIINFVNCCDSLEGQASSWYPGQYRAARTKVTEDNTYDDTCQSVPPFVDQNNNKPNYE